MARTKKNNKNDDFLHIHDKDMYNSLEDYCEECGYKLKPHEVDIGVCEECLENVINYRQ